MTESQARRRPSRTTLSQTGEPAGCFERVAQAHAPEQISGLAEHDLDIVPRAVEELRPYERNPRKHPPKQIEKLAASIREFGFLIPVVIEADGRIIAGHARVEAAKCLGLAQVPTIEIRHLCDAQIRAFRIADNRLAELAQWDEQALAIELKALGELDLNFDVEITGFELAEIDLLIERAARGGDPDEADEIPELDEATPPVSAVGDLWLLAEHRLLCADALKPESYARLLAGETAQMVFTDPPYNVRINGHVGGAGKIQHGEFVMASGEMSEGEFTTFLTTVLANLANQSADGALIYSCMDSIRAIAQAEGLTSRYVARIIPLAFLAPDITEAILEGAHPQDLTLAKLCQRLPLAWPEQRRTLGFATALEHQRVALIGPPRSARHAQSIHPATGDHQ